MQNAPFFTTTLAICKIFVDNMYFSVKEPTDSLILAIQLLNSGGIEQWVHLSNAKAWTAFLLEAC